MPVTAIAPPYNTPSSGMLMVEFNEPDSVMHTGFTATQANIAGVYVAVFGSTGNTVVDMESYTIVASNPIQSMTGAKLDSGSLSLVDNSNLNHTYTVNLAQPLGQSVAIEQRSNSSFFVNQGNFALSVPEPSPVILIASFGAAGLIASRLRRRPKSVARAESID